MRGQSQQVLDRLSPIVVVDIVPAIHDTERRENHGIELVGEADAGRGERLPQSEHEGAGEVVVLETVDHLIPDQRIHLAGLNLEPIADRQNVLGIEFLKIQLIVAGARLIIGTGPRHARVLTKVEPRAKARAVQRAAPRLRRALHHQLEQVRHERVGVCVEDMQLIEVAVGIVEILRIGHIQEARGLKPQGLPERRRVRFLL